MQSSRQRRLLTMPYNGRMWIWICCFHSYMDFHWYTILAISVWFSPRVVYHPLSVCLGSLFIRGPMYPMCCVRVCRFLCSFFTHVDSSPLYLLATHLHNIAHSVALARHISWSVQMKLHIAIRLPLCLAICVCVCVFAFNRRLAIPIYTFNMTCLVIWYMCVIHCVLYILIFGFSHWHT